MLVIRKYINLLFHLIRCFRIRKNGLFADVIICFCCLIRKTTFFTDGHSVILSSDQRESSDDIVREMFADVVEGDIAECSSSADAGRGCIGTIA